VIFNFTPPSFAIRKVSGATKDEENETGPFEYAVNYKCQTQCFSSGSSIAFGIT